MMKSTMRRSSANTMSHTASARSAEAAFCCAYPAAFNCIAVILGAIPVASIIIFLAVLGVLAGVQGLVILVTLLVLAASLRLRTRTV